MGNVKEGCRLVKILNRLTHTLNLYIEKNSIYLNSLYIFNIYFIIIKFHSNTAKNVKNNVKKTRYYILSL